MNFEMIANKFGIKTADLQELVYGNVTDGMEKILNIPKKSIQNFIYGYADELISEKFNLTKEELQFLRYQKGGDGAIGMIVGFLAAKNK